MQFDTIIATYNRYDCLQRLVLQLNDLSIPPQKIIVVDSSDEENKDIQTLARVEYIRSKYKNQPFQRFLGHSFSNSEWLLFLDDDMEILDLAFTSKLTDIIKEEATELSGLSLTFKNVNTFLQKNPKSSLMTKINSATVKKVIRRLTANPELAPGKLWYCGVRGPKPLNIAPAEWVSGGAFMAKRSKLYLDFNYQLFDLYNQKLGKGEDAITGYSLSKQGTVLSIPDHYFIHNDQEDSTYTKNHYSFAKRVLYSRLFLALEYARLSNQSLTQAKFIFHWYALCRIMGMLVSIGLKPSKNKLDSLRGQCTGWIKSFSFSFAASKQRNPFWNDLISHNHSLFKNNQV
jgi:glycosyltransferase involved in cell wall biosynthesis